MPTPTAYRWTLTPLELFGCFKPTPEAKVSLKVATVPFEGRRTRLEGTPYMYQLVLGARSIAKDVVPPRISHKIFVQPGARSGVLVFKGDQIVASFINAGDRSDSTWRIAVAPELRGQGLGARMVEQWFRQVPRPLTIPVQPITARAAATFLRAHEHVVMWAASHEGHDVPDKVMAAVRDGKQRELILARFTERTRSARIAQSA